MGIIFKGLRDGALLGDMAKANAVFFSATTKVICNYFSIPFVLTEIENDFIYVNEEDFCTLVEKVFNFPLTLLYSWACVAAGIYENIKGEKYEWLWPQRNTPPSPFAPRRESGVTSLKHSGISIGRVDVI